METSVLHFMAGEKTFAVPTNVYSNLWPRSDKGGRNFQYYANGYARRNSEIRSYLQGNANHVAVVSDIRKFYPSVQWDKIEPQIQQRLASVQSKSARMAIENCTQALKTVHPNGIPIGPEVAHVLGTLALEDVDKRLAKEFGNSYFRYVDDIIVLCPKKNASKTQAMIREAVLVGDFEIHDGKDDVVTASTWVNECPEFGNHNESNSFEALVRDICLYLAVRPKRVEGLRKQLREAGFSLPIGRMVSQVRYGPFQRFMVGEARRRGIVDAALILFRSDADFVEAAKLVHKALLSSLESIGEIPDAGKGMQRRWFVQQARYRINRLLYLTSPADYLKLRNLVPTGAEFEEYRVLLNALATGDVTDLVRLPGRTVSSFCELVSEGTPVDAPASFGDLKDRAIAESVSLLGLYFGWKPAVEERSKMYDGSRTLLDISTGGVENPEQISSMSFLDEMELLLRDHSSEQLGEIARTRHFEGESLGLEALGLGGGYGFS